MDGMGERGWEYIDGRFVNAEAPDGVLRPQPPADTDGDAPAVPWAQSQIDRAVEAARSAKRGWRQLSHQTRCEHLRRYQGALKTHREQIASAVCEDVGKPLWEARGEADALAAKVDLSLGPGAAFTETQRISDLPGEIRHRPLGVIAVVGPFNFPGHLPNGQIVPALLTGNTVVHKPSERTPRTAVLIAHCLHEAGLPPGVFNLVQGPGPAGSALCQHPDVDGVMFTGSAAVGHRLLTQNLTHPNRMLALELGGKNASIALADCDLEATARAVAFSAYVTAGQRCTATSRLVVEAPIAGPLLSRVAELAQGLRVGHPRAADTFMGPVIAAQTLTGLEAAQALALAAGYTPIVKGTRRQVEGPAGHYVGPSLWRAPEGTFPRQVEGYGDEELFAPDLAAYVVSDREQAIQVANDSRFGLAAAVFCRDRAAFEAVADELRVGVVHWNRGSAGASGRLPFGGVADSGNHRAAGIWTGLSCTFPQSVLLEAKGGPVPATWPGMQGPQD